MLPQASAAAAAAGALSRGKRKRMEKKQRMEARKVLAESAARAAAGDKSKDDAGAVPASYAFAGFAELLAEAEAAKAPSAEAAGAPKRMSLNARKQIVAASVEHFNQVLAHPAFQADPLAAIRTHLENTLPGKAAGAKAGGEKAKAVPAAVPAAVPKPVAVAAGGGRRKGAMRVRG